MKRIIRKLSHESKMLKIINKQAEKDAINSKDLKKLRTACGFYLSSLQEEASIKTDKAPDLIGKIQILQEFIKEIDLQKSETESTAAVLNMNQLSLADRLSRMKWYDIKKNRSCSRHL